MAAEHHRAPLLYTRLTAPTGALGPLLEATATPACPRPTVLWHSLAAVNRVSSQLDEYAVSMLSWCHGSTPPRPPPPGGRGRHELVRQHSALRWTVHDRLSGAYPPPLGTPTSGATQS